MISENLRTHRWIVRMTVAVGLFCGLANTGYSGGDLPADLAVGIPQEDRGTIEDAGAVNVIYSKKDGLSSWGNQFLHQDAGLDDVCEEDDHFGNSLAYGDFNGDGFRDIVVGVPDEDVGTVLGAGAVNVIYGSKDGLTAVGDQLWTLDDATSDGSCAHWDNFGESVVSGDFNRDGYDDLAIGLPGREGPWLEPNIGAVTVIYGSASGLSQRGSDWWTPFDFSPTAYDFSRFGRALAAGDFNADGYDDLAIGASNYGSVDEESGAAYVIHGAKGGLDTVPETSFLRADGFEYFRCEGDRFGDSLDAADFDHDGYDDLVVGAPGVNLRIDGEWIFDAGVVHVFGGSGSGLTVKGSQVFHQNSFDSHSPAEADDEFGHSLATGDFNGDGFADLVIGVPHEDWGATVDAGMIHVLWGSHEGIDGGNAMYLLESTMEPGSPHSANELFGYAIAAGDFDGDSYDDLAIGAPGEDLLDGGIVKVDAGIIFVIDGNISGLYPKNLAFGQCLGLLGTCDANDRFGTSLAASR